MDSITIRQVEINAREILSARLTEEQLSGVEAHALYRIDAQSLELVCMIKGHAFPPRHTHIRVPATWWDHLLDTLSTRFPALKARLRIRYRSIVTTSQAIHLCPHHKLPAHVHIGWLGGFTE